MTKLSNYPKYDFVRVFDIEAIFIPIVYNKRSQSSQQNF